MVLQIIIYYYRLLNYNSCQCGVPKPVNWYSQLLLKKYKYKVLQIEVESIQTVVRLSNVK